MRARISRALLHRIMAEAHASHEEVCGLLFGSPRCIDAAQNCRNVAAHPGDSFEIEPAALLTAHKAARRGGPAIAGCYHSHPNGSSEPSTRDAAAAARDGSLWLIVGGSNARLWRARTDKDGFEPVEMELTDGTEDSPASHLARTQRLRHKVGTKILVRDRFPR